jgi:hypothetical protein
MKDARRDAPTRDAKLPLVNLVGPRRFIGEQLAKKRSLRQSLADDGHGAPVGLKEEIGSDTSRGWFWRGFSYPCGLKLPPVLHLP